MHQNISILQGGSAPEFIKIQKLRWAGLMITMRERRLQRRALNTRMQCKATETLGRCYSQRRTETFGSSVLEESGYR